MGRAEGRILLLLLENGRVCDGACRRVCKCVQVRAMRVMRPWCEFIDRLTGDREGGLDGCEQQSMDQCAKSVCCRGRTCRHCNADEAGEEGQFLALAEVAEACSSAE